MKHEYRFGPFVLSEEEKLLLRDGRMVPIAPKVLETLIALLAQRGRVISRAALLEAVWPDSFIEEGSLTRNISILRKLLFDDFPEKSPIETVSKVGYRFCVAVEVQEDELAADEKPLSAATSSEKLAALSPSTAELVRTGHDGAAPSPLEETASLPARGFRAGKRLTLWLAGAACLALLAGASIFWKWQRAAPQPSERYRFTQATFNQSEDHVTAAAISPDGKRIAYADADGVRLKMPYQPDSKPLQTPPERVIDRLAWFSDQQHIALSGVSRETDTPETWILSTTGGTPILMRQDARRATPAPFGTRVAFTDAAGSAIWCMEDLSHPPRRILQGAAGDTFPVIAWSPNGKTLLVGSHQLGPQTETGTNPSGMAPRMSYLAIDTDTGKITAAVDNFEINDAVSSPSGVLLFSREEPGALGIWTVPIDPNTGAMLAAPQKQQVTTRDVRSFTMSASGRIAAIIRTVVPRIAVGRFHFDQPRITDIEPLSFSTNESYPHAWAADSSSLYFEEQEGDHYRLLRQKLGMHDAVALTPMPNDQAYPLITPDNQFLLFLGREKKPQPWRLYRLPLSGGSVELVNTKGPMGEMRCPLHARSCFLRRVEDRQRVVFYQLDPISGLGPAVFSLPWISDDMGAWNISPDGTKLVLGSPHAEHPQVSIIELSSGKKQTVSVGIATPIWNIEWAIDSSGWFLSTRTITGSDLYYLGADGKTTLLRQVSSHSWMVPAPNGEKVAFIDQRIDSNVWIASERE